MGNYFILNIVLGGDWLVLCWDTIESLAIKYISNASKYFNTLGSRVDLSLSNQILYSSGSYLDY